MEYCNVIKKDKITDNLNLLFIFAQNEKTFKYISGVKQGARRQLFFFILNYLKLNSV